MSELEGRSMLQGLAVNLRRGSSSPTLSHKGRHSPAVFARPPEVRRPLPWAVLDPGKRGHKPAARGHSPRREAPNRGPPGGRTGPRSSDCHEPVFRAFGNAINPTGPGRGFRSFVPRRVRIGDRKTRHPVGRHGVPAVRGQEGDREVVVRGEIERRPPGPFPRRHASCSPVRR